MKLTKDWYGNKPTPKPKRIGPKPKKLPFQLLGLPGPREKPQGHSIDEVRRQAVLMSSRGFREALPTTPTVPTAKGHGRNKNAKTRRGATE